MSQPSYTSATGYIAETWFTLIFSTPVSAANPPSASAFQVQVNGTDASIASITVNGPAGTVRVNLASVTLLPGDLIDFAYTDPTGGNDVNAIQGTDGADAASFSHSLIVSTSNPVCFLHGTKILTDRGEVPVERLREGDLVATRFAGLRPIRWIGTQRFDGSRVGASHQPVRLAAGSLGPGMPARDLWVSPGHAVLVDELLTHAFALVNGSTITQPGVSGAIQYYHLDLGPHDCVLADGAWAESYFEDRNRDSFHNAATFHARFPGHRPIRQHTCLPIVTAGLAPRKAA